MESLNIYTISMYYTWSNSGFTHTNPRRPFFLFDERPDSLTLVAPRQTGLANIGFVLYHKGVAVNDYRYLSTGNTVNLDWQDAWYSAFPERGMRRQYYSPMTGFIYVEPYEVRKEIIVRPADIQRYVDLGLDGETTIPAERHDEIKDLVVEFLSGHFPVKIDATTEHRDSLSALVKAFDGSAELSDALGDDVVREARKRRVEKIAVIDAGLLVREIILATPG